MVATIRLLIGLVGSLSLLYQASAEPLIQDQVRIMALGLLARPPLPKLNATNIDLPLPYSQIRFVGTQPEPPQLRPYCGYGAAYDWPHEGHGSYLATYIAQATVPIPDALPNTPLTQPLLQSWLRNPRVSRPDQPVDIILMHLGTNDIWQNRTKEDIVAAYSVLLNQMRAVNPRVRLLVAQILPMEPANCPGCAAKVQQLNQYISVWAQVVNSQVNPNVRPVRLVDQYTGSNATRYTTDGVHPNARGDEAIAQRWLGSVLEAVEAVVDERLLP
ncbi:cellulose-binding protein [Pseudoneurospora amorphoporcata]|uniref:Cellulose-binding protein n=1 Tax=Pseudoneurospora amorphoporcata TaxID=241081 RepID=A0AAN6P0G8_9PEZI|nr:cellulose-binding protein [Pseudoneurospora amorphoporcata]